MLLRRFNSLVALLTICGLLSTTAASSSSSAETGRWKVDGSNCYWDANDDGPDQCDPNNPSGRYKDDGNGGCYWEPSDFGADQCTPQTGRYKDDGIGGCYWAEGDSGPDQCQPGVVSSGSSGAYSSGSGNLGAGDCYTATYNSYQCWDVSTVEPSEEYEHSGPSAESSPPKVQHCEWVAVVEVVCPSPDPWFPQDDSVPPHDPGVDQNGGGGTDSNALGKDHSPKDGYADCEWTAVASSHPRGQLKQHKEGQLFGTDRGPNKPPHQGLDYSSLIGDQVNSVTVGRVTVSDYDPLNNGNYIRIYNEATHVEATYIHLSSRDIQVGAYVVPGTPIGKVGDTGATDNAHLHLQFKNKSTGLNFDPLSKMGAGC